MTIRPLSLHLCFFKIITYTHTTLGKVCNALRRFIFNCYITTAIEAWVMPPTTDYSGKVCILDLYITRAYPLIRHDYTQ